MDKILLVAILALFSQGGESLASGKRAAGKDQQLARMQEKQNREQEKLQQDRLKAQGNVPKEQGWGDPIYSYFAPSSLEHCLVSNNNQGIERI